VAYEGGVVGAFASWRPLLCERSLAVSVGLYRCVVVADAVEAVVDREGLDDRVVVPLLKMAPKVPDWPTVTYGSGQLDVRTRTEGDTSSPAGVRSSGGASFSVPAAHVPCGWNVLEVVVYSPERTRGDGVKYRRWTTSRITHCYRAAARWRRCCRGQRRRFYCCLTL
jgi:hypothetical protein